VDKSVYSDLFLIHENPTVRCGESARCLRTDSVTVKLLVWAKSDALTKVKMIKKWFFMNDE
jgi:hypothetical protein